jgi:hypothetical protein
MCLGTNGRIREDPYDVRSVNGEKLDPGKIPELPLGTSWGRALPRMFWAMLLVGQACPGVHSFWLARLADVEQDVIEHIVSTVPSELITELARRFALAVTAWSRPRLLEVGG